MEKRKNKRYLALGEASFNVLYWSYLKSAKKRKLKFDLNRLEFRLLISNNCTYCGTPPKQVYHPKGCNGGYVYNGIDRVKNNLGYVYSNCVPCCSKCNMLKMKLSQYDFLCQVTAIYRHIYGVK